ncbi:MAG: RNA polymerase sigma factor [Muribaculaceae bacterium]|nr:RNA polymerase sigma factor [Muribaculaceae bacterium]
MKQLISETYLSQIDKLVGYISKKVNDRSDAEDLAQDAFVRLLNYPTEIRKENIRELLFTVASNLVNDYLRHLYVKNDVHAHLANTADWMDENTEQKVVANDLANLENKKLSSMPGQRRIIYIMRMHEGKTSQEVADKLGISKRTAENHFHLGITQMREYFRACV